ncbi:MAG: ATP-binding protein [Betaproteobacteria bacterium]|nr:ATP-binding protein [Betaproteobacteria bacterium]
MTNDIAEIPAQPAWVEDLRQKYLAGQATIFVLHGNVFDKVVQPDGSWMLGEYLVSRLFGPSKGLVFELGWSQGLRVVGGKAVAALRASPDTLPSDLPPDLRKLEMPAATLAGGLGDALRSLENAFLKYSAALILPYAGTLLPATDVAMMSNDERATLTTLHRWSLDNQLSRRDCVVVLVCESLQEIHPSLLSSPRVVTIEVPLPDLAVRRSVASAASNLSSADVERVALHTSGLRAIQIEGLVASSTPSALNEDQRFAIIVHLLEGQTNAEGRARQMAAITAGKTEQEIVGLVAPSAQVQGDASHAEELARVIHDRKREIIEKECAGLLSFMESRQGLEAVGGNEKIKTELMDIARQMKTGDRRLAPMGLFCVGPMGSGKTFVVRAFLKEAGLTGVALMNIRSKWQGTSEANLERVLATVKAMGPIAVVIDESDRSFGGKEQADTDGGVSARMMARLKEFMSDTDNRGQVLFILMTNRPDRIETDLKRPGRLDRKVPFFYCETAAERADVLRAILRKDGAERLDRNGLEALCKPLQGYSNADLEAVGLLALEFASRVNVPLDLPYIQSAIEDFIPSREEDMIQLMELLAAQETSRRSLLPERFNALSTAEINAKVAELKRALREGT